MKKTFKKAKEKTGRLVDRVLHSPRSSSRSQSPAPDNPNLSALPPGPPAASLPPEIVPPPPQAVLDQPTAPARPSGNIDALSLAAQDPDPSLPAPASITHGRAEVAMEPTPSAFSGLEVPDVAEGATEEVQIVDAHKKLVVTNNNSNVTYNSGSGNVINNNSVTQHIQLAKDEPVMKEIRAILGDRFVLDASHETLPAGAGCLKGTRVRVLKMFISWAKDDPMRIFWLAGLAGTGKTSIAVSLCKLLGEEPKVLLCGTFFCSRTANIVGQTDARRILPTLAGMLAEQSPNFAAALRKELDADVRAALKPISTQIDLLLQRPLAALSSEARPILFVIDALDECHDETEVKMLLQAISVLKCDATVKFILTSRPETHISTSPISSSDRNSILRLHTIESEEVTEDLRLYINKTFGASPLGKPWYSETDVKTLATLSEGLFIFASTIMSYVLKIQSANGRTTRLQTALSAVQNSKIILGPLDAMYEFVLTRASDSEEIEPQELEVMLRVLASILSARVPLSVRALADLLELEADELRESLGRLQSVIHVPEEADLPGLRTLHASFGDYLLERATSRLRVTTSSGNDALARGCLNFMRKRLHFNISDSRSSYEPNSTTRPGSITLSLEYACTQWVYHIGGINKPGELDDEIDNCFRLQLLFWLEVMSVLGRVWRAAAMLLFAASTVRSGQLVQFFRDARVFVSSSREAIERSAAHIYLSALPFSAKDSLVYQIFAPQFTGLISVEKFGIDRHGVRLVMTLTGHDKAVNSVAYSPDGTLIASGSADGRVRIWDTRSGDMTMSLLNGGNGSVYSVAFASDGKSLAAGTDGRDVLIWNLSAGRWTLRRLSGHSERVYCVTFSPDGSLLASAGRDSTVRLWKAETGEKVSVMEGRSDWVRAVAFSPVSDVLASGSGDKEIRLWHGATGEPIGQSLCRHNDLILSVSFHPEVLILASGSDDNDVRLWNTQTGECIATLHGHSSWVLSVQFSPDGRSLVSGGLDGTVRLWTIQGDATETSSIIFEGHSHIVKSVTFSPDGLYIASASRDRTIRIWDGRNGQTTVQPLHAHSDGVDSVAVSSDGEFIVSGSDDNSVRVWNAQSGEPRLSSLLGHTGPVCAVAASPDNSLIASASKDGSIRFWDARTSAASGEPLLGHNDEVRTLAFSSDGRWIASGLSDKTVCIWDVATRQMSNLVPMRCEGYVYTVAFSPDALFVAACDSTGHIYFWNMDTGQPERQPFQASVDYIRSIAFSPTGTHIASGGDDKVGRVRNVSTGDQTLALEGHTDYIRSIVFSSNGQYIGTGSYDRTVRLWNATSGTQLAMLHGHSSIVMSVVFTPDGQSIVSGSWDSTIRIWDVDAALSRSYNNDNHPVTTLASTKLKDGWLLGPSGELLLWVPADYQTYLCVPPCTMVIGRRRIVVSAADGPIHRGGNWTKTWSGNQFA